MPERKTAPASMCGTKIIVLSYMNVGVIATTHVGKFLSFQNILKITAICRVFERFSIGPKGVGRRCGKPRRWGTAGLIVDLSRPDGRSGVPVFRFGGVLAQRTYHLLPCRIGMFRVTLYAASHGASTGCLAGECGCRAQSLNHNERNDIRLLRCAGLAGGCLRCRPMLQQTRRFSRNL